MAGFDLIFGTSTGSIIGALIALGHSIDEIQRLYKDHVPIVMRERTRRDKSAALAHLTKAVFGERMFTDVKTAVGIVATRWEMEKPMIFKGSVEQAHGRYATFVPGFGCMIADAVHYVESGQIASPSCCLAACAPAAWVSRPHSGLFRPECQAGFRSHLRSCYKHGFELRRRHDGE